MLLSTKDLKYQMQGRRLEKLTKRFVGPYQVKKIILTNAIELDLPSTVKIHLVINISRVYRYKDKCYKMISKEETISHTFINLMENIKEYNTGKI